MNDYIFYVSFFSGLNLMDLIVSILLFLSRLFSLSWLIRRIWWSRYLFSISNYLNLDSLSRVFINMSRSADNRRILESVSIWFKRSLLRLSSLSTNDSSMYGDLFWYYLSRFYSLNWRKRRILYNSYSSLSRLNTALCSSRRDSIRSFSIRSALKRSNGD